MPQALRAATVALTGLSGGNLLTRRGPRQGEAPGRQIPNGGRLEQAEAKGRRGATVALTGLTGGNPLTRRGPLRGGAWSADSQRRPVGASQGRRPKGRDDQQCRRSAFRDAITSKPHKSNVTPLQG